MSPPLLLAAMTLAAPPADAADQAAAAPSAGASFAPPNLPLPTLGGMQFWGDVTHRAGWRVQRHVVTGHHRLLDELGRAAGVGRPDGLRGGPRDGGRPPATCRGRRETRSFCCTE